MKLLKHSFHGNRILIYKNDGNILEGSFFDKKPEVGDVIISHALRTTNGFIPVKVLEIVENTDAKVNPEYSGDPAMAHFVLKIERCEAVDLDVSIKNNSDMFRP